MRKAGRPREAWQRYSRKQVHHGAKHEWDESIVATKELLGVNTLKKKRKRKRKRKHTHKPATPAASVAPASVAPADAPAAAPPHALAALSPFAAGHFIAQLITLRDEVETIQSQLDSCNSRDDVENIQSQLDGCIEVLKRLTSYFVY